MLSDEEKRMLNQFADALERKLQRDWARTSQGIVMDFDAAVAKVAEVLRAQWRAAPAPNDPGYAVFAGSLAMGSYFSELPPPEEQVINAIQRSGEDHDAFLVLKCLLALGHGDSLPVLRLWGRKLAAGLVSEPPRRKGAAWTGNVWRDHLLVGQIQNLIDSGAGFDGTRNDATHAEKSACDIVAKATHLLGDGRGMTYSAVKKVWDRRKRLAGPRLMAKILEAPLMGIVEDRGKN